MLSVSAPVADDKIFGFCSRNNNPRKAKTKASLKSIIQGEGMAIGKVDNSLILCRRK